MARTAGLKGEIATSGVLSGRIAASGTLHGELSIVGTIPAFQGPFSYASCDDAQVVSCTGLIMPQDIIIEPVPSNYGKIGWDGVTLTVS